MLTFFLTEMYSLPSLIGDKNIGFSEK